MKDRSQIKRGGTGFSTNMFHKIANSSTFKSDKIIFQLKSRKFTGMVGETLLATTAKLKKKSPRSSEFGKAATTLGHSMPLGRVDEKSEYEPANQMGPFGMSAYKLSERGGGEKLMSEECRGDLYTNDHSIGQD